MKSSKLILAAFLLLFLAMLVPAALVSAAPGATIGDRVWYDFNGDGVQDASEPGIPNVTLKLTNCASTIYLTRVTDANGNYLFEGLPALTFCVIVDTTTLPAGVMQTFEKDGTLNGNTQQPLTQRQVVLDVDFGYKIPGTIGDRVWYDNDGDGVQDAGEAGIPNVTVNLTDCSGNVLATDVTDSNGNYLFDSLAAGTYCVVIDTSTLPANVAQTFEKDGSLNGNTLQPLAAGGIVLDVDFGYQLPRLTLGDRVWYDQDQDGIQDANEPGYNGATVALYDNATCSGSPMASTTTGTAGPDGFYQFTNLPAGNYCLQFGNIPAGWSISPADQGADNTADSDANGSAQITNINLSADDPDEDMGIYVPGSLGDSVVCISTGAGLANITVTLFEDFNGDGVADGPAIATTETDANGFYQFTGLEVALAGDPNNLTQYIVQVDVNDADLGTCNLPVPPTEYNPPLDSDNPDDPNNDFEFAERLRLTLGDRVWYDQDQDGIQDANEPGYQRRHRRPV